MGSSKGKIIWITVSLLIVILLAILFNLTGEFGYSSYRANYSHVYFSEHNPLAGAWNATTSYPLPVYFQMCATYNGYIYCVGGLNSSLYSVNSVYYSKIGQNGSLSGWHNASAYPIPVAGENCEAFNYTIYCLSGYISTPTSMNYTNTVYSAKINPNGSLSSWKKLNNYPVKSGGQSCVLAGRNIYCIGGINSSSTAADIVFRSEIFSNGSISGWHKAFDYPINISAPMCVPYNTSIECITGFDSGLVPVALNYYGSLSSNGSISGWHPTLDFPIAISGQSCVPYSDYIYCVGGVSSSQYYYSVYYSTVSQTGQLGIWNNAYSYPSGILTPTCTSYGSHIYCIGGALNVSSNEFTPDVYYADALPSGGLSAVSLNPLLFFLHNYFYPVIALAEAAVLGAYIVLDIVRRRKIRKQRAGVK